MHRRTFLTTVAAAELVSRSLRADEADPAALKATQAVLDTIATAEADPDRPVYHFRPPANWCMDPNGTMYYRGWHHLCYQFNPFSAQSGGGHNHWGHARSRDLVNWEHLPIAIWPSADRGERATISGGAVIAGDGRPRLVYTSTGHPDSEQWMMIPKDDELFHWEKYQGNPILTQAAHIHGPILQWRDPFMFKKDGATYMVCGGGTSAGRAQVQLYLATKPDLTAWQHLGPIFQYLDRDLHNFECPNLFPLDGKFVLIVSLDRPPGTLDRVCEYWIGDLDIAHMQFTPSACGVLDAGDAYASNISVDDKGRTLLWLWGRTNTPPGKGWGSVMTMPRILSIGTDGYLRQQAVPEFETLRRAGREFPVSALDKPSQLDGVATDCAEIEAVFSGFGVNPRVATGTSGLELRRSADGKPGIVVSIQGAYINVGRARAFVGTADRHRLRIFLDKRCIEVYADDGAAAVYNWFDAGAKDLGVAVFGQAAAGAPPAAGSAPPKLESLKIWPMQSARFDLERFKA